MPAAAAIAADHALSAPAGQTDHAPRIGSWIESAAGCQLRDS